MTTTLVKRNNWSDFQKVTLGDLDVEQVSNNTNVALVNDGIAGSGVRLDFPQEVVIFDSESLTSAQQGFVGVDTFDGRGILAVPVPATDLSEGNQVAVSVTGARLDGIISMDVTIIGKTFDNSLIYEHLKFNNNGENVTSNHFKEVTNVLFQNFLGNVNTSVDGYGSFNVGGVVKITEASSYKVSYDLISNEQSLNPDLVFKNYKTYDAGKTLDEVLQEAVGSSNDIEDLNIVTATTSWRLFTEGASTETMYAQKFKMDGNNIQKVTILLSLESGTSWSGNIVLGIRPLLTSVSSLTEFIPDNGIDFNPNTNPLEEISVNLDDLASRGIELSSVPVPVDFIFTGSRISNPNLSNLIDKGWYALTIKRSGSSTTGTILLDEVVNETPATKRLSVFNGSNWTDVSSSTLWYKIWSDSVKVASGVAYDDGVRIPIVKTRLGTNGVVSQNYVDDINLANNSEGTENYLIVKKSIEYSDIDRHPRTGDPLFIRKEDAPEFSVYEQADLLTLMVGEPRTVVLARVKDSNSRNNPTITDTLYYPGLAYGNVINVINPSSDLLNQNVVGSTITPDTLNPTFKYRITSQEIFTDLYGDVDGNGIIDVFDSESITELDGYQSYLATTGTYSNTEQQAALVAGYLNILEVLRADVAQSDGYEVTSSDLSALNNFINDGTAFPNGMSTITRVRLTVEPIMNPSLYYDSDANSTLQIHIDNPNLTDPSLFSFADNITLSIDFIPTWTEEFVEITDLRRYVTTTFLDFNASDLQSSIENGGENNLFVPGNLYLTKSVLELDGTTHPLDMETSVIELELPSGDTKGEINIFEEYVDSTMYFSDGTLVSNAAINNNQVRFEVAIASHCKNLADDAIGYLGLAGSTTDGYGLDFDGYNDGYGANADEVIGTYIDHDTGLLRIRSYNIVRNELFPELRSRIQVSIFLKKAGFANMPLYIDSTTLASKLSVFST